jgi:hypothetical protein
MDKESFFLTLFVIWYFSNYLPTYNVLLLINNYYNKIEDFFTYCNNIISPEIFKLKSKHDENNEEKKLDTNNDENTTKLPIKYEDKYLVQIRNMDKEFKFNEKEEELKKQKYDEILKEINDSYLNKIQEIQSELNKLENVLKKYEKIQDNHFLSNDDYDDEDIILGITKEEIIMNVSNKMTKLYAELYDMKNYYESLECIEKNKKDAQDKSKKFIIDKRLEKLQNCFVIECTPLGNVLMLYDNVRETFKFYSDNTIPYRYLEVVARKYIKQFWCRPIFVDMEYELKIAEEKWEKERKDEEDKKRKEQENQGNKMNEKKQNVFAKFKNYNSGKGFVNKAAPPKNSLPNTKLTEKQENEKILLKENANRYTYEGKIANFSFIKKVERKVFDKKLAMTFADFKRMKQTK